MAALERGLHVLCEKPLGMSSAQAREMTETAEPPGVVNMCPFTYSFMPYARYTKELVDGGYIGGRTTSTCATSRTTVGTARTSGGSTWARRARALSGDLGSHFA